MLRPRSWLHALFLSRVRKLGIKEVEGTALVIFVVAGGVVFTGVVPSYHFPQVSAFERRWFDGTSDAIYVLSDLSIKLRETSVRARNPATTMLRGGGSVAAPPPPAADLQGLRPLSGPPRPSAAPWSGSSSCWSTPWAVPDTPGPPPRR